MLHTAGIAVYSTLLDRPVCEWAEEIRKNRDSYVEGVKVLKERLAKEKAKRKEAYKLLDEAYE